MSQDVIRALLGYWIAVNAAVILVVFDSVLDARKDVLVWRSRNGHARGVIARGRYFRERMRLFAQVCLLGVAIPVPVVALACLLAVPLILASNTLSERRDRAVLARKLLYDADAEAAARVVSMDRIERKIDENTAISQGARDDAHEAAEVANNMNDKIRANEAALLAQGASAAADRALDTDTNETAHRIDDRVHQ